MAESYYELLKHPKWQEKRLRIMERDRFKCSNCDNKDTTLNVHHTYYTKGAKPWEYPDESLRCLCENCHEKIHASLKELKAATGSIHSISLEIVVGFAKAMAAFIGKNPVTFYTFAELEGVLIGVAQLHNMVSQHAIMASLDQITDEYECGGTLPYDYLRDVLWANQEHLASDHCANSSVSLTADCRM